MMMANLLAQLEPGLERELYAACDRHLQPLLGEDLDRRYLSLRRHLRLAEIAAAAEPGRWDLPLNHWLGPRYWLRKELLAAEEFRLRGRPLPGHPPRGSRHESTGTCGCCNSAPGEPHSRRIIQRAPGACPPVPCLEPPGCRHTACLLLLFCPLAICGVRAYGRSQHRQAARYERLDRQASGQAPAEAAPAAPTEDAQR